MAIVRHRAARRRAIVRAMEPLDHDAAYKGFYGHPFMVEELARWLLPARAGGHELVETLDFATLARVQEQSVGEGRKRSNDMVWRVRFRDRGEDDPVAWMHLVLMLEFQSTVDHLMALRCRQYVDNFHMENLRGRRFGAADRLPPVLAVVIYNGVSRWTAARRVIDLVTPPAAADPAPDLSPASPLFGGDGYLAVDSGRLGADDSLPDNAAALLAGIEHPAMDTVFGLVRRLSGRLRDPDLRTLRESVLAWAQRVVERRLHLDLGVDDMAEADRLQDPEEEEAYWEARRKGDVRAVHRRGPRTRPRGRPRTRPVRKAASKVRSEGRAEARAEERALLQRQAARRFGADAGTVPLSAFLEGVDDAGRLAEVGDWIVDCASGAELAERLGGCSQGLATARQAGGVSGFGWRWPVQPRMSPQASSSKGCCIDRRHSPGCFWPALAGDKVFRQSDRRIVSYQAPPKKTKVLFIASRRSADLTARSDHGRVLPFGR